MEILDFADIQGFILTSYASNLPCANYLMLKVGDAATCRTWLGRAAKNITNGLDRKTDYSLNIAFTYTGLTALGFGPADLATFSAPFQDGMATEVRSTLLGDTGESNPANWNWGNSASPVDILLLLFASDETELSIQRKAIDDDIAAYSSGISLVTALHAGRMPDSKEHFGFLDGVGQPVIEGTGRESKQISRTAHATVIKAGEFILGHDNEMLMPDPLPTGAGLTNFGLNGTYLVFRQLEQHVHKFWQYVRDTAGPDFPMEQDKLAAKIVGRWQSGAPITIHRNTDPVSAPAVDESNNFEFRAKDADGFGCPVGAHIRRTNPRDSLFDDPQVSLATVRRHRIMRRGRSYGDRSADVFLDDNKERGLHFICVNSNIERQFEFVQQSWANNPSFDALNNETDPLIGQRNPGNAYSIQGCPVRTRIHELPEFITTKGGAYFFMPGIKALRALTVELPANIVSDQEQ